MDESFDLDLDASRIAYRDGETVGLANLGLRGEDAWIGGIGVVPAARRTFGDAYVLNLPAEDPAAPVLGELGGSVVVRQHEMLLELGH